MQNTVMLVGLGAIFLYYLVAWVLVGRDPKAGTITPQYAPPRALGPAALRYIYKEAHDDCADRATILNLAAHGFLRITKPQLYRIEVLNREARGLAPEEVAFGRTLFADGDALDLASQTVLPLQRASSQLGRTLATTYLGFFHWNSMWLLPGGIASFLLLAYEFGGSLLNGLFLGGPFMVLWLSLWSVAVLALCSCAATLWRRALRARTARATAWKSAMGLTLFCLPFLAGEGFGAFMLARSSSPETAITLVASIVMAGVFLQLLKAPTAAGRAAMDEIEGFREFLKTVDMDAINRINPPAGAPLDIHPNMPYALALDIESDWAEKFDADLHWDRGGSQRLTPEQRQQVLADVAKSVAAAVRGDDREQRR